MSQDKFEQFKTMFAERFPGKDLSEGNALKDLGLDSLDVVEMCLDLEDKFGIAFDGEDLAEVQTVGDLFGAVKAKLS